MQEISQEVLNNLSNFISSSKNGDEALFSYVLKISIPANLKFLNELVNKHSKLVYFSEPEKQSPFIAIGFLKELVPAGETKISSIQQNFNKWENRLFHNWNQFAIYEIPIIISSIKFDTHKYSDKWNDYPPISFYVPKIILLNYNGNSYGIFNFIIKDKTQLEEINKEFKNEINRILNLEYSEISAIDKTTEISFKESYEEKQNWDTIFTEAKAKLHKNEIEKIVLSREEIFQVSSNTNWDSLFDQLEIKFPNCYCFLSKSNGSYFFGVSPEKFITIKNGKVEVEAVAGSAPRSNVEYEDKNYEQELLNSSKNLKEHKFVADFVSNVVKKYSNKVSSSISPMITKLENIQHLVTKINAELKSNGDFLQLIEELYPTPAVCGVPKNDAMQFIRKNEQHDRGLYSGLIGWMDFKGNCDFSVAIRSALLKDNEITAFAGAGILEDSDIEEEFLETQLKLNPILELFNEKDKSK